jgi:hypothetical protein
MRLSFTCSPPRGGGDNLLCRAQTAGAQAIFPNGLKAPEQHRPLSAPGRQKIIVSLDCFHPRLWPAAVCYSHTSAALEILYLLKISLSPSSSTSAADGLKDDIRPTWSNIHKRVAYLRPAWSEMWNPALTGRKGGSDGLERTMVLRSAR